MRVEVALNPGRPESVTVWLAQRQLVQANRFDMLRSDVPFVGEPERISTILNRETEAI